MLWWQENSYAFFQLCARVMIREAVKVCKYNIVDNMAA